MKNLNYFNLVILFAVMIIISVVFLILDISRNMFFADEWDTPGNILSKFYNGDTLVFSDFFSQHNESRKIQQCKYNISNNTILQYCTTALLQ